MLLKVLRGTAAVAAGIAVLLLAFSAGPEAAADSVFAGSASVRQCNALPAGFPEGLGGDPACPEVLAANTTYNVTVTANVLTGSSGLDRLVGFMPGGYTQTDVLNGAKVGGVRVSTCSLDVDVVLYDVALPDNLAAPRNSTNIVFPRDQGQTDRFGAWHAGADPEVAIADSGADGHADPASLPIAKYPAHLLDYFDPDGAGAALPVVPSAVYGGLSLQGSEWVPLYIAAFPPGALQSLPGPLSKMTAAMGQPFVYVIGDPTATVATPGSVIDTCAPVSVTSMLLGQVGATVRSQTSGAGTQPWLLYASSRRDVDQDGIDNNRDSCPAAVNTGDSDGDGLDGACDPDAGTANSDEDSDGVPNTDDNCPLVANGGAAQADADGPGPAADLGPVNDGIGDACDSGSLTPTQNGRPVPVTLDATVANGRYHVRTEVFPKCIGGTDADADGYCAGQDAWDTPTAKCPTACTQARHSAWGPAHPGQQMDSDGDFFSDAMETYVGTDATKSCAQDNTAINEAPLDNWPLDFSDNGDVNYVDLSTTFNFPSALWKFVGQDVYAKPRYDLNKDGFISTLDMTGYVAAWERTCAGVGILPFSQQ